MSLFVLWRVLQNWTGWLGLNYPWSDRHIINNVSSLDSGYMNSIVHVHFYAFYLSINWVNCHLTVCTLFIIFKCIWVMWHRCPLNVCLIFVEEKTFFVFVLHTRNLVHYLTSPSKAINSNSFLSFSFCINI